MKATTSRAKPGADARYVETASILKALGHPLRVKIVCGLLHEPCTQTRISACLGIPQSSIAQHLDVLRRCGLVGGKRSANEVLLYIADRRIPALLRAVCSKGKVSRALW